MKPNILSAALLSLSLLGFGARAHSATCAVATSAVAFGAYDPQSNKPRDTNSAVQVTCSGSPGEKVGYVLALVSPDGERELDNMSKSPGTLQFNLYLDIARTQVWGDGTNGTAVIRDSVVLTSSTNRRDYTIYGRISGGQRRATAGHYQKNFLTSLTY